MIRKHGLAAHAKVILYIAYWKVHKSQDFGTFLFRDIPWAIIIVMPAGCTGILQPVDVGIGQVYKHIV